MEIRFKPYVTSVIIPLILKNLLLVGIFIAIFFTIFLGFIYQIPYVVKEMEYLIYFILLYSLLSLFWGFIYRIGSVKNTSYQINNEFVTEKMKFIYQAQSDVPFSQITNVDYKIGWFWDKIFNTGSILIYTAGTGSVDMTINNVKNVVNTYEQINDKLHLKKSVRLKEDGEFESETNSEFLKRVKPNSKYAVWMQVIIPYFFMIFFTAGLALVVLPIILIIAFLTHKAYSKKYYDFYEDKLEYYDGFLTLNKSTIPMERITNISENQMIFDRIFGTYTIHIQTAGSSGAEIVIKCVTNGSQIVQNLKGELKKHGRN